MVLAMVMMLLLPATALAGSGIFGGGYTVNAAGAGANDYTAVSFNGANLGTIGCGQTLLFVGGYVDTWKNSGSDVTGATIYYRVYPQGSPSGSYTNLNAPFLCNKGMDECSGFSNDGDQRWRKSDGTTDVAAGLGPGTYTIEAYSQASATNPTETHSLNNGNANYKATFTVLARTKATSGNWNSGSTWEGDAVPGSSDRVEICNGHTVTLTSDQTVRSVRILSGGTLQDTGDPNTLTIAGTSSAKPSFTVAGSFSAGTGTVVFSGESNQNGTVVGGPTFYNVTLMRNSGGSGVFGVDMSDGTNSATIGANGTLTINSSTFVAHAENGGSSATDGSPTYANNSTLKYSTGNTESDDFDAFAEWVAGQTGSARGVPYHVQITNNTWVGLRQNVGNREMRGNLLLDDSSSYRSSGLDLGVAGSSSLKVAGTVTNGGTLKQTKNSFDSGTFHFAQITDGSATKYYGVDLTANNSGNTTVWVSGNRPNTVTCPDIHSGSRPVRRCYLIDVANANSTSATFYYTQAELRTDLTPPQSAGSLKVWRNTSGTSWTELSSTPNATCNSGQLDCSVQASSFTPSSIGGLRAPEGTDDDYVLMQNNPQAVTLADFHAVQQGDAVLVTWETASELGNRGFNLYRGTSPAGWDRQLNAALIPSQSQGSPGGFVYTWTDQADLTPGTTYYYWLEDLDLSGATTMHGPVSVDFVVPTAVTLAGAQATPAAALPALPWLAVVAGAGAALALGRRR